jgi:hypothetical protein
MKTSMIVSKDHHYIVPFHDFFCDAAKKVRYIVFVFIKMSMIWPFWGQQVFT